MFFRLINTQDKKVLELCARISISIVLVLIGLGISMESMAVKNVTFSLSKHPSLVGAVDIQDMFNKGAALLKKDDDGPGSGNSDDVSLDIKFTINTAAKAKFPDQSSNAFPVNERYDYTLMQYNIIRNDTVMNQLLGANFSDIKQIKSGYDFDGVALPSSKPARIILAQDAIPSTAVHEFGHCAGLNHRNTSIFNIMYDTSVATRNEINQTESNAMNGY